MFKDTKVKGIKIPFHIDFEEVNLRFYVRYKDNGEWKRGVVFIKEIVPKPALTLVANVVYKENYETMSMKHAWTISSEILTVEYHWKKKNWNAFQVVAHNTPTDILNGSEEEFITEHYWGYTKVANDKTSEYEVEHPKWQVYKTIDYKVDVDFADVYGMNFDFLSGEKPRSVFLAEGSPIKVNDGKMI